MADTYRTGVVGADGRAVIELRPDGKQTWEVQQVSPEMPSAPGSATGNVRRNGALVAPFAPAGDAVGGEPYPRLVLGDVLTVEWANCTPGAACTANFFYEVIA